MWSKRFMFSWILSAIVMFVLSYMWHGLFLNDIKNLKYPVGIFLMSASVVYLVIGFVLVKLFSSLTVVTLLRHFFIRGLVVGAASGLLLYMMALVLGVTFTKSVILTSIIVDVPWQIFEQIAGGIVISTVYALIYEPLLINRSVDKV
jgi:hypothetical protein